MVGPLDKRRRMTRCLGCAKRRIKVWDVKLQFLGSVQLILSSVKEDFHVLIAFDKTRCALPSSNRDMV